MCAKAAKERKVLCFFPFYIVISDHLYKVIDSKIQKQIKGEVISKNKKHR